MFARHQKPPIEYHVKSAAGLFSAVLLWEFILVEGDKKTPRHLPERVVR